MNVSVGQNVFSFSSSRRLYDENLKDIKRDGVNKNDGPRNAPCSNGSSLKNGVSLRQA